MSLERTLIVNSQTLVAETFKSFRAELLAAFGNVEHTRKDDTSPVTAYDVSVETRLRQAIEAHFPDIGFEGEETKAHGNRTTYWLVDPIDGTSSFIRGLDYSTNMAALVHEGIVVAAVIYDFVRDILYTAVKGEGAYKNGVPIAVNTTRRTGELIIYSLTRSIYGQVREALAELGMRTLLPMGAAGHAYAMLAEGKIDGVVVLQSGTGLHDNAPGVLLAEEAGAVFLAYDDKVGVERHEYIIGSPFVIDEIEKSGLL